VNKYDSSGTNAIKTDTRTYSRIRVVHTHTSCLPCKSGRREVCIMRRYYAYATWGTGGGAVNRKRSSADRNENKSEFTAPVTLSNYRSRIRRYRFHSRTRLPIISITEKKQIICGRLTTTGHTWVGTDKNRFIFYVFNGSHSKIRRGQTNYTRNIIILRDVIGWS